MNWLRVRLGPSDFLVSLSLSLRDYILEIVKGYHLRVDLR